MIYVDFISRLILNGLITDWELAKKAISDWFEFPIKPLNMLIILWSILAKILTVVVLVVVVVVSFVVVDIVNTVVLGLFPKVDS